MARMDWDADKLGRLVVDLNGTPRRVQARSRLAMDQRVGPMVAREMKTDARGHKGNWFGKPGTEYNTPLEKHVSHEMIGPFEVEVGIERKGAGKLAHIIVFGSVNNGPVYDHMAGPRRALPRVVKLLGDTGESSMLGDDE